MSSRQKDLERLCRLPTPVDITWTSLKRCLGQLGYDMHVGGGSRRRFVNQATKAVIFLHEPHPEPCVKAVYVKLVVAHLREQGLLED
jgi:hypothetical protein